MNELKNIAVLGAGESGVGAARLARKNKLEVFVSDFGVVKDKYKQILNDSTIDWEEGKHSEERILNADAIVKSPGIPPTIDLLKKAKDKGIPILSEIEFAFRFGSGKVIAITGSNGKTTTSHLVYHILDKAGKKVALVGNVGDSYAGKVADGPFDYYVVEISSFQLEDIIEFKPDISVILNITPDHLDRYDHDLQKYVNAKFEIQRNQDGNDYFIYNLDDKVITNELKKRSIKAKALPFSIKKKVDEGAYSLDDQIFINLNNNPLIMSIQDLALQGKHNIYNSMAASIAGRILELRKELIRESLSDFQNIEHRLEFVMKVHGISFINDSKATNVNSTWYALESIERNVIWIVGGVDKGNDYMQIKDLVADKVKAIVCLGKDNKKLKKAFGDVVPNMIEVDNASDAVKEAYAFGKKGDTVLLSPACASFDLFENYEDRGHQFKKAVRAL